MPMDWTPPPRNNKREPDFSKAFEELKQRFPRFGRPRGSIWIILVVLALLALGGTSYYTVGPDETGLVLRFGRFIRQSGPGLHFKIPMGVERVLTVKTGRVFKEEFGFRGVAAGVRSRFNDRGFDDESLMLTGDLNVIDVKWIVQYKIRDPYKFLFEIGDPQSAIRDSSESVMRAIVGNRISDAVLTLQRVEIAAKAQDDLQQLLDTYNTGIQVVTVKLQDVNPPEPVQPAFNEVNEARQQKERMINEAQEAYNREIPKAQGEAQRAVSEAEGYASEKVNRAQGEASRFTDVLQNYAQAKEVTKRRFYLEAMQRALDKAERVWVVDDAVKGLLPMMRLDPKAPQAASSLTGEDK